jgi:hypothetical protein
MVQKRNGLQEKSYGPRKVMVSTKKLWFPEKLWSQKSYGLHIKSYGLHVKKLWSSKSYGLFYIYGKVMVFFRTTKKLWSHRKVMVSKHNKSHGRPMAKIYQIFTITTTITITTTKKVIGIPCRTHQNCF